jgi:hypothetical protein
MSTQRYLPACIMYVQLYDMISVYLYDVCLLVWCLLNGVMSARPYYLCSIVWCQPTCIMFAQVYDVYISVWCLLCCIMSAYLYDGCLPTAMSYIFCFAKRYETKFPMFSISKIMQYSRNSVRFASYQCSRNKTILAEKINPRSVR